MKKIFISHDKNFKTVRGIQSLLKMLGAHGVLAEDERDSGISDRALFGLMKPCQGLLVLCTRRPAGEGEEGSPAKMVAEEIREWEALGREGRMVILREKGCRLPELSSAPPTYEFEGIEIAEAIHKAFEHFQTEGVLSDVLRPGSLSESLITEKETKLLIELAGAEDRVAGAEVMREHFKFSDAEWNAAIHKLQDKFAFIYYNRQKRLDDTVELLAAGMDYLMHHKLI